MKVSLLFLYCFSTLSLRLFKNIHISCLEWPKVFLVEDDPVLWRSRRPLCAVTLAYWVLVVSRDPAMVNKALKLADDWVLLFLNVSYLVSYWYWPPFIVHCATKVSFDSLLRHGWFSLLWFDPRHAGPCLNLQHSQVWCLNRGFAVTCKILVLKNMLRSSNGIPMMEPMEPKGVIRIVTLGSTWLMLIHRRLGKGWKGKTPAVGNGYCRPSVAFLFQLKLP